MDKLVADYPKARIVFQNYPLERIHTQAKLAAEYAVCVTKAEWQRCVLSSLQRQCLTGRTV